MNDKEKTTNVFAALKNLYEQQDYAKRNVEEIHVPKDVFDSDTFTNGFIAGWEAAYSDAIQRVLLYLSENCI